jgi:MFS transporter
MPPGTTVEVATGYSRLVPSERNLRRLLAGRGFRRLLAVRLSSQLSDGLFSGALAGTILFNPDQQSDPVAIAAGFAVLLLPYSVLGPYVGVFLDRWPRRHVLVYANLIRCGLAIPAGALVYSGHGTVPFILLALLITGINRLILAGHSAGLPHVVDGPRLLTGNALSPTLGTVCNSLGLGISAGVQLVVASGRTGYGLLAWCAAVGYLTSSLLARAWFRAPDLGPDDTERRAGRIWAEIVEIARGMVAGLGHLSHRPAAASVLAAQSAYRVLYGILTVAALLLYRNYFSSGTHFSHSIAGLAQVVVAGGAGSLVGAAITPPAVRRLDRVPGRGGQSWVTLSLCGAGLLVIVLGSPFSSPLLVLAVFAINVAAQNTKIVVDTTLQRECADDFRGRVFSVNDTTYNVCFVLGLFLGAVTLPADGHSPPAVLVVGVGYAAVGIGYRLLAGGWGRYAARRAVPDRP